VRQRLLSLQQARSKENLIFLKELIEAGQVSPVVDRTYPLGEVARAVEYLESGQARGKVVIAV
jgi:NADPH:quinone reductase-like Zn-dependent oxidoreductase